MIIRRPIPWSASRRGWRRFWPPGRKLGAICVVVSLLTAVIPTIALLLTISAFQESRAALREKDLVLAQIATIAQKLAGAGVAERGYIILGEQRYLAQYTKLRAELPVALNALRGMISRDPEQRKILDELGVMVTERVAIMDDVIGMGPAKVNDIVPVLRSARPLRLNELIVEAVEKIRQTELAARLERIGMVETLARRVEVLAMSAVFLALFSASFAGLLFVNQSSRYRERNARDAFNRAVQSSATDETNSFYAQELARPLTLALNYLGTVDPGQQSELTRKVAPQVESANQIASVLRDRVSAVAWPRTPREIGAVILEVVDRLDFTIPEGMVEIDVPDRSPPVLIDVPRIQQVLAMLIDDRAADQAPPAPRAVMVSVARLDERMLSIRIRDPARRLPDGVAVGQITPWPAGALKGPILSLAVCERIIRAHGGQFSITNLGPGGAEFSFTLPIAPDVDPALA